MSDIKKPAKPPVPTKPVIDRVKANSVAVPHINRHHVGDALQKYSGLPGNGKPKHEHELQTKEDSNPLTIPPESTELPKCAKHECVQNKSSLDGPPDDHKLPIDNQSCKTDSAQDDHCESLDSNRPDSSSPGIKRSDSSSPGIKRSDTSSPGIKRSDSSACNASSRHASQSDVSSHIASNHNITFDTSEPIADNPDVTFNASGYDANSASGSNVSRPDAAAPCLISKSEDKQSPEFDNEETQSALPGDQSGSHVQQLKALFNTSLTFQKPTRTPPKPAPRTVSIFVSSSSSQQPEETVVTVSSPAKKTPPKPIPRSNSNITKGENAPSTVATKVAESGCSTSNNSKPVIQTQMSEDLEDSSNKSCTTDSNQTTEKRDNPKAQLRRRPTIPPPPPPQENSQKKPIPKRPPPPVPSLKLKAGKSTPTNSVENLSSTTNANTPTDSLDTHLNDPCEDNYYAEPDDCVFLVESSNESSVLIDTLTNTSPHDTVPVDFPGDAVAPNPDISIIPATPVPGCNEEVYLDPSNKGGDWPVSPAPFPPTNTAPHLYKPGSQSSTLKSSDSNIYEDVSDSDSEYGGHSSATTIENDDIYSQNLDETLESETKAGSSSDSETEATDADEKKAENKKEKLFNVAKEIMTSEEEFIDKLRLLNIDFRKHISDASEETGESIIPSSCMNSILKHLPQLTNVNEELHKDFKERVENWDKNPCIADIFVRKGAFLKMYITYIKDFTTMTEALEQARKEYPVFAEKLLDFEKSGRCKNLKLSHYMLKPIQRIPQYKLLLKQYQKYLPEDSPDKDNVAKALNIVSEVAEHSNSSMKEHDSLQSLLELQNILIGDDFKVIAPSRVLLKRGDLYKQSRKKIQPRALFLFNDNLVITVPNPPGYYRIKYVLPLDQMQVKKPVHEDFQKEFTVVTTKKSFAAVAYSPAERDGWVEELEKAIKERDRKIKSYHREFKDTGSKEFELGAVAPVWIPDSRVTMCMICNDQFTTFNRRHHCRACGKVVCGVCSDYKAPLQYTEYKSKRVCSKCHDKLLEDLESSDKSADASTRPPILELKARFRSPTNRDNHTNRPYVPKVLQEVHASDEGVLSGYLHIHMKKKTWKRFWFVLKDKVLYKYNESEDSAAIESRPLLGYAVTSISHASYEGVDASVLFQLNHSAKNIIEPILFRADTSKNADQWRRRMEESTKP